MTNSVSCRDVWISAVCKQLLDSIVEAKRCGYDEGCVAVAISRIDVSAVTNENCNGVNVALAGRNVERGPLVSFTAASVYIDASMDQS